MRSLYERLILLIAVLYIQPGIAQTTVNGSFVHSGVMRTYSFYVPAIYSTTEQAVPLVLNLHGYGTDGAYQAENRDFRPLADSANFIVVHPDGTIEPNTNQRFWNYGNVAGSTVDDVGFLEALIDTISGSYNINQSKVYAAGMSNGSFMCYYMACQSNRLTAIGTVTGSMSVEMYNNCNPVQPIPVLHIHGESDGINPYGGNATMKGIESVVQFWVDKNACNTTPDTIAIPDNDTNDDATAERYVYNGGMYGNTVELFKVTGGGHTWPGIEVFSLLAGNTCMDFSASKEIWRFFNQHQLSTGIKRHEPFTLSIWPNPSNGRVHIQADNEAMLQVKIYDQWGREVFAGALRNSHTVEIDVSALPQGMYIVQVSGSNYTAIQKLFINR